MQYIIRSVTLRLDILKHLILGLECCYKTVWCIEFIKFRTLLQLNSGQNYAGARCSLITCRLISVTKFLGYLIVSAIKGNGLSLSSCLLTQLCHKKFLQNFFSSKHGPGKGTKTRQRSQVAYPAFDLYFHKYRVSFLAFFHLCLISVLFQVHPYLKWNIAETFFYLVPV